MTEKKNTIRLKRISIREIHNHLDGIEKNSVPLWRRNKEGKWVIVPLHRLKQFFGSSDEASLFLFIQSDWEAKINKLGDASAVVPAPAPAPAQVTSMKEQDETDDYVDEDVYKKEMDHFRKLTFVEREEVFDDNLKRLNRELLNGGLLNIDVVSALVEVTAGAFYINKATMEDNYKDQNGAPKEHMRKIAQKTIVLVNSVIMLLSQNEGASNYLNLLETKSTGSTTSHMTNVFLRYIPFCLFYNTFFDKGLIARVRAKFTNEFQRYYRHLLPGVRAVTLETVFKGGLREIAIDELQQFALGTLLHDIGKLDDISYFEGEDAPDRKKIVNHAPSGYNMIMKTREFSKNVAVIAALHHDYYDGTGGYGIRKLLYPLPDDKFYSGARFCITRDLADLQNGLAIAYFPAKILEIIDVFDALTDKKRNYRKVVYGVDQALEIMREEFFENHFKIDPVLLSIFSEYINR